MSNISLFASQIRNVSRKRLFNDINSMLINKQRFYCYDHSGLKFGNLTGRLLYSTASSIENTIHKKKSIVKTELQSNKSNSSSLFSRLLLLIIVGSGSFYLGQNIQFLEDSHFLPFFDQNDEEEATKLLKERENLELISKYRNNPEWEELSNPYQRFRKSQIAKSLTAATLRGKGKFGIEPLIFFKKDGSESIIIQHVGARLCGHEDVVHGGLLATIMDESLAFVALPKLYGMAYTGKLEIYYRAPTPANSWIIINPKLEKVQGRKAFVHAEIRDTKGNIKTEANAIFIAPRYSLGHLISFFR